MNRLALLATAAIVLAAPGLARATTIQTTLASFQAAAGTGTATTSTLGTLFAPVTTVKLVGGASFTLNDAGAVIDQPGMGVLPFSNGYSGQVIDSSGASETLTFAAPVSTFGLTLQPDVGFFGPTAVAITITLGDGTSTTVNGSYVAGNVQFIGFTGGPEKSLTISTSKAPDFSFGQFLTAPAAAVPEPASLALLATGLLALPRRRRS